MIRILVTFFFFFFFFLLWNVFHIDKNIIFPMMAALHWDQWLNSHSSCICILLQRKFPSLCNNNYASCNWCYYVKPMAHWQCAVTKDGRVLNRPSYHSYKIFKSSLLTSLMLGLFDLYDVMYILSLIGWQIKNPLCPSDAIWQHRPGSTLPEPMLNHREWDPMNCVDKSTTDT